MTKKHKSLVGWVDNKWRRNFLSFNGHNITGNVIGKRKKDIIGGVKVRITIEEID